MLSCQNRSFQFYLWFLSKYKSELVFLELPILVTVVKEPKSNFHFLITNSSRNNYVNSARVKFRGTVIKCTVDTSWNSSFNRIKSKYQSLFFPPHVRPKCVSQCYHFTHGSKDVCFTEGFWGVVVLDARRPGIFSEAFSSLWVLAMSGFTCDLCGVAERWGLRKWVALMLFW